MIAKNKGIIPINKINGWTSFDVVNKIKHLMHLRQVGHLGTLDPMATGVLLITIGRATKLFDLMQEKIKIYRADFEFGYLTDTLDSTGKIISKSNIIPTIDDIKSVLKDFVGKIEQIPPKYSAKNINGQRAYDLARKGEDFSLPAKTVEIYELNLLSYTDNKLTLEIKCGSGTYIRAIGRDIAEKLNTQATMTSLVRTSVGGITEKDCVDIKDLSQENVQNFILPIDKVLSLPTIELDEDETKRVLNGQIIPVEVNDGIYLLNDDLDTIALINVQRNKAKMSLFLA